MKLSILSIAALLAGVMAEKADDGSAILYEWSNENCERDAFIQIDIPWDSHCWNAPTYFQTQGVRLVNCPDILCTCTLWEAGDCEGKSVQVNNEFGSSTQCRKTEGFFSGSFVSAACTVEPRPPVRA